MGPGAAPHLVLEGLTRRFGATTVVDGIHLEVAKGSLVALLGPSGCGKTTTLRMVAGLDQPDAGRVLVDGRDVTGLPPHRRRMGVVFQSYALFPHMSAAGNVGFGLRMHGMPAVERDTKVQAALTLVGLGDRGAARPRTLSGGQQQRVALARALAIEPDVLLLDEPLSALDAKLRDELRVEMRAIQRRAGATTLFVTHDQTEAMSMADIVAVMHQGRIAQAGSPQEVFEHPDTAFVAGFVGRSAQLAGVIEGDGIRAGPALLRAAGLGGSGPVQVFIRPHHLRVLGPLDAADNVLEARVTAVDYAGETAQLITETPCGRMPAEVPTHGGAWQALQPGTPVRLGWAAADTLWFPA